MEYAKPNELEPQLETTQEIFKARITAPRDQTVSYFDHLINTDLQSVKDLFKGHQMTEKILARLTKLSKQYFVIDTPSQLPKPQNEVPEQKELKLASEADQQAPPLEISLASEKVKMYKKKSKGWLKFLKIDPPRDFFNLIAFKNLKSYMIGLIEKKLVIVEDGAEIYSQKLDMEFPYLDTAAYIEPLNCYLLNLQSKLYRKDIDSNPPYIFMNLNCGMSGGKLIYLEKHKRLIMRVGKSISAINLETKEVEFESFRSIGEGIISFQLLGGEGAKQNLVSLTYDGYALLHELDFEKKLGHVVGYYNLELDRLKKQGGSILAVCPKKEYILVEEGEFGGSHLSYRRPASYSRMVLLKIEGTNLIKKAELVIRSQTIRKKTALKCCGYSGRHLVWVGLTTGIEWPRESKREGIIQLFDYDIVTGELKELQSKRVSHQELSPMDLQRIGGHYYYTGGNGNLMKLSINF